MTYQPYEAAGTQTTVPPTGYGMPPYGTPTVTQPGDAGGDFGPFTPPQGTPPQGTPPQDAAPGKTKWVMVIGIAATVVVFAVAGVFLLKPGPSPTPAPTPPISNHVINSTGGKGGGSTGSTGSSTSTVNSTPTVNTTPINTPADASGAPESSPAPQQTTSAADADTQYLDELSSYGGDFSYLPESELLGVGNAACADFENGNSAAQTVSDAANALAEYSASSGIDDQDMAIILLDATSTLCPAYGPQMRAYADGDDSSD